MEPPCKRPKLTSTDVGRNSKLSMYTRRSGSHFAGNSRRAQRNGLAEHRTYQALRSASVTSPAAPSGLASTGTEPHVFTPLPSMHEIHVTEEDFSAKRRIENLDHLKAQPPPTWKKFLTQEMIAHELENRGASYANLSDTERCSSALWQAMESASAPPPAAPLASFRPKVASMEPELHHGISPLCTPVPSMRGNYAAVEAVSDEQWVDNQIGNLEHLKAQPPATWKTFLQQKRGESVNFVPCQDRRGKPKKSLRQESCESVILFKGCSPYQEKLTYPGSDANLSDTERCSSALWQAMESASAPPPAAPLASFGPKVASMEPELHHGIRPLCTPVPSMRGNYAAVEAVSDEQWIDNQIGNLEHLKAQSPATWKTFLHQKRGESLKFVPSQDRRGKSKNA